MAKTLTSAPILCFYIFFVSFTSTSYTLFQANILYNLKENEWTKLYKKPNFGPNWSTSGAPNFFYGVYMY